MIQKITDKIIHPYEGGVIHSSGKNVRTLTVMVNTLIDKVNELIDENDKMREEIKQLKYSRHFDSGTT